jgi:hypothetical protein
MTGVTINCCLEFSEPQVKLLRNEHAEPYEWFAVLEIGPASVILPGHDRAAVAFLYRLSSTLELRAQELEALLAPEAAEIVSPS